MEELEEEIPRIWSLSPFASHTSHGSIGSADTSLGCDWTCPVWTFWERSQLPLHLHLPHHGRCLLCTWAALTRNTQKEGIVRALAQPRRAAKPSHRSTKALRAAALPPLPQTSSLSSSLVAAPTRTQAVRSLPSKLMSSGENEVTRAGLLTGHPHCL